MICRQCGTEIADKAIVCYRCGAATTEPQFKPFQPKRSLPWAVIAVIVLVLLALAVGLVLYLRQAEGGATRRQDRRVDPRVEIALRDPAAAGFAVPGIPYAPGLDDRMVLLPYA
jgi:hypothetical protein